MAETDKDILKIKLLNFGIKLLYIKDVRVTVNISNTK
jgi:hypothetical protein